MAFCGLYVGILTSSLSRILSVIISDEELMSNTLIWTKPFFFFT